MISPLDNLIEQTFNWRDYLDGYPDVNDLPLEFQRSLVAAYIVTNPDELLDAFGYLGDMHADKVGHLVMDLITPKEISVFSDAVFLSARRAFLSNIQARVDQLYDQYVAEYGIFTGGIREPSELIGFRREPD